MVGMVTQGTPCGSCRWGRPGLPSDAPLGLYRNKRHPAASQMSKLQTLSRPAGWGERVQILISGVFHNNVNAA
jgi:hypothetical protein